MVCSHEMITLSLSLHHRIKLLNHESLSAILVFITFRLLIIVHVRHMVSFFHTPTLKKSRQEKKVDMKQKDEYTTCTINIGFHFNLCEKRSLLEKVAPILPIQYHLISLVRTGMRKYMFLPCFWGIFFLHLE